MSPKVLIATQKPFAEAVRDRIVTLFKESGLEPVVLETYQDGSEFLKAIADVSAVIIRSDKVTEEVLDAAKELKLVVRAGAGYDNVNCAAAAARDVVVENTPGQNANAVAELTFGLMVMMARGKYNGKPGTELKGKRLGVHAYGNIGRLVGELGKGFGMEVCAFDPFIEQCILDDACIGCVKSVEELYATSDYVSLHIPATPDTLKSIDYKLLSNMKQGGTLVNTARAEVINEEDLLRIMEDRPDIKYTSDIAPKNADTLREKFEDRVFFTPKKMGAQTFEANFNAGVAAANQVISFLKKGEVINKVN